MTNKRFPGSMARIISRMSPADRHEDWWVRHHRLASRLFTVPIGQAVPLDPAHPFLDGLCGEDETWQDPAWLDQWTHSGWVLHYWRQVFSERVWWRGPDGAPNDATCPLCAGLCRFQITASEPNAPESSTCAYVPWSWIKPTLQLFTSKERGKPWSRKEGESVYDYLARSFQHIRSAGLADGAEPTAYIFRIVDQRTDETRHVVAHTPTPDGTNFTINGVFATGIQALAYRIEALGPTGMHEVTEKQAEAHLKRVRLRDMRIAQAAARSKGVPTS